RAAARQREASVEVLADGSVVALFVPQGSATEKAKQAARCALAMRAAEPGVPVVVATARGSIRAKLAIGEAIDRAIALLRADPLHGLLAVSPGALPPRVAPIRVDEITASLLDDRFDV